MHTRYCQYSKQERRSSCPGQNTVVVRDAFVVLCFCEWVLQGSKLYLKIPMWKYTQGLSRQLCSLRVLWHRTIMASPNVLTIEIHFHGDSMGWVLELVSWSLMMQAPLIFPPFSVPGVPMLCALQFSIFHHCATFWSEVSSDVSKLSVT